MSGNGGRVMLTFDLGVGSTYRGAAGAWAAANYLGATGAVSVVATNGATFYLTGVKLEIGSVATPFNRQSLAKSMADCQRYYQAAVLTVRIATSLCSGSFNASYRFLQLHYRASPCVAAPTATIVASTTATSVGTLIFMRHQTALLLQVDHTAGSAVCNGIRGGNYNCERGALTMTYTLTAHD